MTTTNGLPRFAARAAVVGAVVLVIAALHLAREVLIPFALAVLLAFLLGPLVARLERRGVGHLLSVTLVAVATAFVTATLGLFVINQLADLLQTLPSYGANIQQKLRVVAAPLEGLVARTAESFGSWVGGATGGGAVTSTDSAPVRVVQEVSRTEMIALAFNAVAAPMGLLAIVVVLAGAMLVQGTDVRDRLVRLIGDDQVSTTTKALDDVADRIGRYLLMQTCLNGSMGLVVALGLFLIGVPGALLWGLIWAMLRFLPYIGPWLGAMFPIVVSLGHFEGWTQPLFTIVMFVVIESVTNMVLEPWLYGSGTGLSPLAVLVSAIFWTWLWGWVGLLLATPLTACMAVLGRYVSSLEFLHVILGDEPALRPSIRFYQRLLAGETDEARAILSEEAEKRPLADVYESIVVAGLARVDRDHARNLLDEDSVTAIHGRVQAIVDAIVAAFPPSGSPTRGGCICLPVRDEADALCGRMLRHVLSLRGVEMELVGSGRLASEQAGRVAEIAPDVILLSAVASSREPFVRYALKRIPAEAEKAVVLLGMWDWRDDKRELQARLGDPARAVVVTSFSEAVEEMLLAATTVNPRRATLRKPALIESAEPAPVV